MQLLRRALHSLEKRPRDVDTILEECRRLAGKGVKELLLLGQSVNSSHDKSAGALQARPKASDSTSSPGFKNLCRLRGGEGYYFTDLVAAVSDLSLELRVRFTSPHPKDFPPNLLALLTERPNVCKSLHLPAQSGGTTSSPASAARRRTSTGTHCRSWW